MAYIVGTDRYQTRMVTTSLDDLISKDNSVRVIDSYVESLNLENLGFIEYSGRNRGQSPYRRFDLLKLHIYGYLNKIRSSRALETEAKRNLELMWLINCITPDHGTIAGFVQKNKAVFHNTLRNLTLILKGWGLIDGELIVIDGTKIRAQNSKHNCIKSELLLCFVFKGKRIFSGIIFLKWQSNKKGLQVTQETYTSERWGKEGGTTIHQISFTVDISKIKDLPLLYKLIDELKDAQNRTDSPTPATT